METPQRMSFHKEARILKLLKAMVTYFEKENVEDITGEGLSMYHIMVSRGGRKFQIHVAIKWECSSCKKYHTGDCDER